MLLLAWSSCTGRGCRSLVAPSIILKCALTLAVALLMAGLPVPDQEGRDKAQDDDRAGAFVEDVKNKNEELRTSEGHNASLEHVVSGGF